MSEPSSLLTLVARMKVGALAQLAGTSVEDLVAAVIQAPWPHARPAASPPIAVPRRPSPEAVNEPPLAAMLGRATYKQIRNAVDRWALGRAFEETGTMTGVAQRLRIGRHTVPRRLARVHRADRQDWSAKPRHPIPAPPPPSLTELYERGGRYAAIREAFERWLLGAVLAHTNGNVLKAARTLEMPRTQFRKRWARAAPSNDGSA